MIVHRVEAQHGLVIVTPENPDDLWALRRVISSGDLVAGETTRVFKETSEYARPDKERIKVTVTIETEHAELDSTLTRLRVVGKIVDVSNELLSKGSFHSLSVSEGHRVSIRKPRGITQVQLKVIRGSSIPHDTYSIVAIDQREAGIGVVKGTHLQILPTVESGLSGKMYQDSRSKKYVAAGYFENVVDALSVVSPSGGNVFVLGPGTTKNSFANYIQQQRKEFGEVKAIEGSDVSGEDGVYVALRNQNLQSSLAATRLIKVSKIVQEAMRRISQGDSRVSFAFSENLAAAKEGAVESILVSNKIFSSRETDEESIVTLLNKVEEFGGETFLLDSSTDLGNQVNSLGGVVGLLRFPLKGKA